MGHRITVAATLVALLGIAGSAAAASLTPAAITAGFGLSTYESGYPNGGGIGPIGLVVVGSNVWSTDYANGILNIKPDVDGQIYASTSNNYNPGVAGLALLGGNVYMAQQFSGAVSQLNGDGTPNHVLGTYAGATGIVGNSVTNHLYLSNTPGGGIREIDLAGNTVTTFGTGNGGADGLTISSDNATLYAEQNGHIFGYNTTTHAQVFDSGSISGGPDGVTIGAGTLAGNLFVNTNGGQLIEIDIATLAQTVIVTGGSRGDFVTVDPNNNSMLFTQTDSILRLTAPTGGGFDTGSTTPLPSAASMGIAAIIAMGGVALLRRRRAGA